MFKSAKRKKSHGFTLAEVLIVVAIIGILLAVAIPNVISYYRSLKLTELDDSARSIFVAAQNRLTAMKSAGANLYALSTVEVNEKPDPGVGTGRFLAVTSAQADSLASLVPGGSIESQLHDNHYVVEIDAKTGAVYAVWYWEKEHFDYVNESYDEVKPEKDKRLGAGRMVGYYGGSFVDRPTIGQTPMPSAQVVNAEELKLKISVPGFATGTYAVIKANVTISAGGKTVPIVPNVLGSQGVDLVFDPYNNVFEGEIALDTLDESKYRNMTSATGWSVGKSFKNWAKDLTTGPYAIAPGANIDIEVKVTAVDTSGSSDPVNYLPQYLYWEDVNSLFASVEEDSVTGEPVTAKIAYGRHLQNLNKDISGVTDTITAAEQTRNIDFDATGVSDVYSWAKTYPGKTFTPINNNNLTSYKGAGLAISELLIDETGDNVGLFGVTDAELDSIRLVNADIKGGANVGALAGQYSGSAITNCGAYVDEVSKPDTVAADEHPYDELTVEGAEHVGGLVGNITSTTAMVEMQKSFASVKVTGTTDVGGLVGQVNSNSAFTNCYSGGHTEGGTYKSDANVTGTNNVGGLVGSVADGKSLTLNKINYSTCSVKTSGTVSETGLLVGTHTGANGTVEKGSDFEKAYATGEAFDLTGTKITTGLHNENTYLDTDRGTNSMSDFITVPYDETLKTTVYPCATNLNMHYGDWLEEASASSFCYYDVVNGTYGVWGYIVDPAGGTSTSVNTLASDTYATDDGYCVLVKVGDSAPTNVTVDGKSYDVEQIKDAAGDAVTVEHGGNNYNLYKIKGLDNYIADVNGDGSDDTSYYYEIDLGGAKYWFNPFFACEIVQETTPDKPATPQAKDGAAGTGSALSGDFNGKVVIRTARQLANLAAATGSKYDNGIDAQNRSYVQLLNIDFEVYSQNIKGKGSTTWEPAALNTGSYDGNTFVISNLYINKTGDNIGMFGNTKGTLKNIRLKNTKVSGGERVGALVGRLEGGNIDNCGVYVDKGNYDVCFVKGEKRVGGLAGHVNSQNNAELKGCFAAVKVVGTSGNDGVGGLIGCYSAKDNTGIIEDCYSGGHTEGGIYTSANVSCAGKNVGGLIGKITDEGKVTLKGTVYSTCSVSGNDSDTIGLLIGGFDTGKNPTIDSSDATVYATGKAFDSAGGDITPRNENTATYTLITDLTDSNIQASTTKDTTPHPYDGHWKTVTKYPYLSNLGDHYGDWVEKKKSVEACFYWAKEGNGYEVYVLGFETGGTTATPLSPISTLCETHHSVTDAMGSSATSNNTNDWGYGTIGLTDTLSGTGVSEITTPAADLTTALKEALKAYSFEDTDVKVYTGATADASTSVTSEIDNPAGGKYTYHLNLGFAAAISMTDGALGSSGTPYQIRNVRQLDNIPDNSPSSFQQTHDVYGKDYSGYVGASDFAGTYDGQSYRILELSITPPNTVKNAALFASVYGGTVENVILYSPSGSATITSTANGAANAAGIVGDLYGNDAIVSNCAVAGYTITVNNPSTDDSYSQCIGGIAGWVSSNAQITNCEAVVELVNKRASGGRALMNGDTTGAFMGGIAGAVSGGGSVNITNCYAGGTIRNEASMSGGSNPYISAGGIVGLHQGSNMLTVSNCYSYMVWSGDVGTQTGQTGRYPIVNIINPYYSSQTSDYNAKLLNTYYIQGGGLWNDADSFTTQSNLVNCMAGVADIGTADADHTFIPSNVTSLTGPYPYPAVVTDEEGKYVHYGDWPTP